MADAAMIITRAAGIAFVVTSMAGAGLAITPRDLGGQLRRSRLIVAALVANFVVAPLLAWGLCAAIPIDRAYATGLLLVGGSAGAPLLPKLAAMARGNVPLAITLMAILAGGTVVFLPFVMPYLLPGARAHPWHIARPLLILVALPLLIGMAVGSRWTHAARVGERALERISNVFLVVFLLIVLGTHLPALWGVVGSGAIFTAMLLVVLSGAAAYGMAGGDGPSRRVLAFGTAQRNIAAALVAAGASFADQPKVIVMVLVAEIVALVALFTAVRLFRRADARAATALAPEGASG